VTVEQEVETLKLYLEIERMRFEERLRTKFNIDPVSQRALLPSLLLQPLVENAIKYAVTPQESGAEITISTQVEGKTLKITVSDTGPGLRSKVNDDRLTGVSFDGGQPVSTGVGLSNIRDRLAQAYGENYRFETVEPKEGGFAVIIELPFEKREAEETAPEPPRLAVVNR
jgi:sensor histidine kinase YesM